MRTMDRIVGVALVAVIEGATVGCSGRVEATSTDAGGAQDGASSHEASSPTDGGAPPHDASGGGPLDAGMPPSGDTCQTPGVQCVTPPPAPSGGTGPGGATPHNYAVHTLYFGDTDRTGVTSSSAWKAYGYNLDNLVTARTSTDVCTLAPGAARTAQVDGNGGIDNSFGQNILPILITTAGSSFSANVNASVQGGHFSDLLYTVGFDDQPGNTTAATGLSGALLGGGDYTLVHGGSSPAWDLGTHWPIRPETLNGCPGGVCPAGTDPIASARVKFTAAYQKDGTFVNGSPSSMLLVLGTGGASLTLQVHSAIITFDPKVPGVVTNGTIGGVLITTELVSAFQAVAGSISTSLCSGSAFQSIAQQIEQASDIVVDPGTGAVSNQAGVMCNAVSIGLGFEGSEIAAPASADITGPTPASPNPCGDQ